VTQGEQTASFVTSALVQCRAMPDGVEPCSDGTSPHRSLYNMSSPISKTLESTHGR
jgi:hypothetical protein